MTSNKELEFLANKLEKSGQSLEDFLDIQKGIEVVTDCLDSLIVTKTSMMDKAGIYIKNDKKEINHVKDTVQKYTRKIQRELHPDSKGQEQYETISDNLFDYLISLIKSNK